ncbi:MAG: NAD(P)-dependent oxidoreductase [Rhodospirillaceae bacterium]|nr:NAD(P)-dependent oxidoreductase [Rhodospirillaceae bacterium]MDE0361389.1 NAD(P)-dependent oxidoreductase [Rhodospirillaceae bacterium]
MSPTVGVIGLGPMGGNIAGNLLGNGFAVSGFDIRPECMEALADAGLTAAGSSAEVAQRADILATSLPNIEALEDVMDGVLRQPKPGQILIECSTLTVEQKVSAHGGVEAAGMRFLDAPISGTPSMLAKMMASIYVSGDRGAYDESVPVLEGFTATNFYVGEVGNASRMKFLANYLVHVHTTAAAECMVLGQKAGLDPQMIHRVLTKGAGGSKMLDIRGAMMAASDYREGGGTMFDVYEKDAAIITEFAASVKSPIDLYVSSRQKFNSAIALGLNHLDTSAVCKAIETAVGIDRELVE